MTKRCPLAKVIFYSPSWSCERNQAVGTTFEIAHGPQGPRGENDYTRAYSAQRDNQYKLKAYAEEIVTRHA